jgi:hypothetical protein
MGWIQIEFYNGNIMVKREHIVDWIVGNKPLKIDQREYKIPSTVDSIIVRWLPNRYADSEEDSLDDKSFYSSDEFEEEEEEEDVDSVKTV